jgi:NAD(P)-dependent dehydrogenase (short-subunit alcohol dehydrogenase family)
MSNSTLARKLSEDGIVGSGARTIVTGGASGIGLALVGHLLAGDTEARCVVVDLTEGGAHDVLSGAGERVRFVRCDVAEPTQVGSASETILADGAVNGLVNCAGIVIPATPTTDVSIADLRRMLSVHVEGTLQWSQAVARSWIGAGTGGSIVNVSSVAARFGWPGRLPYAAAKAAIESMTRTMAVEWAPYGIRVNAVAPGYVDSPMSRDRPPGSGIPTLDEVAHLHALGRVAQAGEIAAAIAFLLSGEASFLTGEILNVDGGYSITKA